MKIWNSLFSAGVYIILYYNEEILDYKLRISNIQNVAYYLFQPFANLAFVLTFGFEILGQCWLQAHQINLTNSVLGFKELWA